MGLNPSGYNVLIPCVKLSNSIAIYLEQHCKNIANLHSHYTNITSYQLRTNSDQNL